MLVMGRTRAGPPPVALERPGRPTYYPYFDPAFRPGLLMLARLSSRIFHLVIIVSVARRPARARTRPEPPLSRRAHSTRCGARSRVGSALCINVSLRARIQAASGACVGRWLMAVYVAGRRHRPCLSVVCFTNLFKCRARGEAGGPRRRLGAARGAVVTIFGCGDRAAAGTPPRAAL